MRSTKEGTPHLNVACSAGWTYQRKRGVLIHGAQRFTTGLAPNPRGRQQVPWRLL